MSFSVYPSDYLSIYLSVAGDPKGAMLTHKNYTATVAGLARHMQLLEIRPGDIIFSYLPLAHTFEQVGRSGGDAVGIPITFLIVM